MDNSIRHHIINNFQGDDFSTLRKAIDESVKAKDRRHIELAMEILGRVKSGEITYEGLKSKISPAMGKFNSQMREIEEEQK